MNVRKIAILYSRMSGYMSACFSALKKISGAEFLLIHIPPASNAPFGNEIFDCFDEVYDRNTLKLSSMKEIIRSFDPDAIFMSGWFDKDYLRLTRWIRKHEVLVIAGSDTQWRGTLKQILARGISSLYLHTAIDVLWVAGERQKQLANRLGYSGPNCWTGVYACDWERFSKVYDERKQWEDYNKAFVFVGRYVEIKGIEILLRAYRKYRNLCSDPWPLICAGKGKLESLIENESGVINEGFIQPDQLPELLGKAGCFILPSRKEPWGVVLQEAAATGLPLICSDACGAAVHLVQDGYNGFIFESGNVEQLVRWLVQFSEQDRNRWKKMSRNSFELSRQFTPERWAFTFLSRINNYL